MFKHSEIAQHAIKGFMEIAQPFDVDDVKSLIENILSDKGKYYDPVIQKELKVFLISMFERGHMSGYCLSTKPIIDNKGPRMILEFSPDNPLATLDLINKPAKGIQASCSLHPQYKDLLKHICQKIKCTQDVMIRSILIKSLDLINEQLK